jgi:hypothetical protein
MEIEIIKDEPRSFSQLMSGFSDGLDALLCLTWCAGQDQGFEPHQVECALTRVALTKLIDLAIKNMGPEEAATFISAVVNERLKANR